MPRNGSGVYSKVSGTEAVSGQAASSSDYNAQVDDMVADANAARPIVAGGTGATTASAALTALGGQATSANLTSLAGLTLAADQGLYSTGADTVALFALTTAGRTLVAAADAGAQRTAIGFDDAVDARIQASAESGSAVIPTTSGSAVTQAIPAGVQEITIIFKGAGWTSTTETVVRVGPSSTPVATGYDSDMVTINASVTNITLGSTIGFAAGVWGAADVTKGSMTLRREVAGANDWSMEANIFTSTEVYKTYGTVSLAGELDIVQLTNNSGGATLDGGGIIVRWR